MSAPLTTREALAAALVEVCTPPMGDRRNPQTIAWGERCADALLASGALTDATKLAEDEALVERINTMGGIEHVRLFAGEQPREIVSVLRALAAALAAQSERAEVCHCGIPVTFGYDGDPTHHRGMCKGCDAVRCDAYPGACCERAEVGR